MEMSCYFILFKKNMTYNEVYIVKEGYFNVFRNKPTCNIDGKTKDNINTIKTKI